MREFAKVSPQIWINEQSRKLKRLGIEAQLIAFYLSTCPHSSMIGVYYLPIAFISHETGISHDVVLSTLQNLEEINVCTYDKSTEYIWVHDMAFDQISSKPKFNDNRVKAIHDAFHGLPDLPFLDKFKEKYGEAFYMVSQKQLNEGPYKPLPSKEKEKDNENDKENENQNENEAAQKNSNSNSDILENNNNNVDQNESSLSSVEEQARRILDFFNEKIKYPYPPTNKNLKFIINWLNEGYEEKTCFYVITNKYREWEDIPEMKGYFKLGIIFGKKFPKYVSKLPTLKPID
jgi:uncharacterized phage protein (TIGR02220 family)